MNRLRVTVQRTLCSSLAAALVLMLAAIQPVSAATLLERSVNVSDPKPGVVTSHSFAFSFQDSSNIGSLVFEYCSNDPLFSSPCDAPAGLDVSQASLVSQSGVTGFSIAAATTANSLVLGRTVAPASPGAATYVFDTITNPSQNNTVVYVRISAHGTADGSGARVEEGAVAFRILTGINTQAFVPPFLIFCTGITVATDCSSSVGDRLDLGELSDREPKAGTSQYAGATNDVTGYSVHIFGTTLTAGNNIIPALTSPTASQAGAGQFGLNLRDNSDPNVGSDTDGVGTAVPSPDYGIKDQYKFASGDVLSASPTSSDYNRFTASYVVNVPSSQAPGIYTATYTFLATASF